MMDKSHPLCLSWEKTQKSLQAHQNLDEVERLLDLAKETFKTPPQNKSVKYPIIVIEGLDGAGKTTLINSLCESLNAIYLHTPPSTIARDGKYLCSKGLSLKHAFYSFGNYLAAHLLQEIYKDQIVILDRYWHSSAAYGIAEDCISKGEELPDKEDDIFTWPEDLQKPTAVIYLQTSEEVRSKRIRGRQEKELTVGERKLSESLKYRNMIEECFIRIRNPSAIVLEANGSKRDVYEKAMEIIKDYL